MDSIKPKVKLRCSLKEIYQLSTNELPLAKIRETLVKDVWLRYLQRSTPGIGWGLEITTSNLGLSKNKTEIPRILRRIPNTLAPSSEITKPLQGFMIPQTTSKYLVTSVAEFTKSYSELTEKAIKSNFIYRKVQLAYIDTQKRQEVLPENYERKFNHLKQQITKIPHPSAYSIPVKFIPQNPGPGNSTSITMNVIIDRLELLPGISGFAIDRESPLFSKLHRMKAEHPLIPDLSLDSHRVLTVVGVANGPAALTPIFSGNDQKSFDIAIAHSLPIIKSIDIHGSVNCQNFMKFIPKLVEENGSKYLVLDSDPSSKARIFEGRNNLPIELANQAVYNYLSTKHGKRFTEVSGKSSDKSHCVPGLLEPVVVSKWFVNTQKVREACFSAGISSHFDHIASILDFENVKDFAIVQAGTQGHQAWRFGLETTASRDKSKPFSYRRSSTRVEGRSVLLPWVHQVYEECDPAAKTPIILERDENLLKKIYLFYALNNSGIGESFVIPQQIMLLKEEISRTWTLKEINELKNGRNIQSFASDTYQESALSTTKSIREQSFDTLRGVLLGSLEKSKSKYLLNDVVMDDTQGVLSLLHYIISNIQQIKGVSPKLPLAKEDMDHVQAYETYTLFELCRLQNEYESSMTEFDFFHAREAADEAILLVAGKYRSALFSETLDILSYERALVCTSVYSLVMQTLWQMVQATYPFLAHELESKLTELVGDQKWRLSPLLLKDSLPVILEQEKDQAPGSLLFKLVDAIEEVVANREIPRSQYRGYVCTDDYEAFGYKTRAEVNDAVMLIAKRICRVHRVMVPEVSYFAFFFIFKTNLELIHRSSRFSTVEKSIQACLNQEYTFSHLMMNVGYPEETI